MSTIELTTSHLREAVAAASKVIQRSPVDVMESVLLSCDGEKKVVVSGASVHGDIAIELSDHHHAPFKIAVNAERFRQMIDRASSEKIKLTPDDNQVKIVGGSVRGTLKQLPAGDFPTFNEPNGEPIFDVEINVAETLGYVTWASGIGAHLKPYAQGPNIVATKPGTLEMFCTTGVSMARVVDEEAQFEAIERDYFVTVPMISAKMLSQVFKRAGVIAHQNRLIVEAAGFRMGVPYIMQGEGRPVPVPKITAGEELRVRRAALLDAVRACGAVSDLGKVSLVSIRREGDVLRVSANGKHGDIEETVDVEEGAGKLEGNFVVPQLSGALGGTHGEVLTIDGGTPLRLRDGWWSAYLMPFRM